MSLPEVSAQYNSQSSLLIPPHFSTLKYQLLQKSILFSSVVFTVFLYSLSVYNLSLLEFFSSVFFSYTATLAPLVIPSSSIALKYHRQADDYQHFTFSLHFSPKTHLSVSSRTPFWISNRHLKFNISKTIFLISPHSTLTADSQPNFHTLTNGNTLFQFLRTNTLASSLTILFLSHLTSNL